MQPPQIVRFRPGLEDQILSLILPIQQQELGSSITAADQPDLGRIAELYQAGRGDFWVGLAGDAVVGTLGLIDFGSGGALRKMFVHKEHRGSGLAQALLDTLVAHAVAAGLPVLVLGTLERMRAAHRFYERNGFFSTTADQLPEAFPRMSHDERFYVRALAA